MCLCCLLVLDSAHLCRSIYLRGIPLGGLSTSFVDSLTSPHSSKGSAWWGAREFLVRHVAKSIEEVEADFGLSVWPGSFGSARPWSFRPSLADVSWAAWPANYSMP